MDPFHLLSLVLVAAALLAWVNHRFVHLPTTIGVMVIALGLSLALQGLRLAGLDVETPVETLLERIDFSHALLDIMLAFLLFAGALHVQIDDLLGQKWIISGLATLGVLVSTLLVGGMVFYAADAFGMPLPFLPCLVFGALISPTDPIAVMGILKQAGAPKSLETKIAGESLFNDGIGVVLFAVLVRIATGAGGHGEEHAADAAAGGATPAIMSPGPSDIAALVGIEVVGAIALGLLFGWIVFRMLRSVDNYQVEVLLTLALCAGVYSLADSLHSSGPLAVVVAGLLIGNTGRRYALSEKTAEHVDTFWELIDEILNVVLFLLIGMEVLVLDFTDGSRLLMGLLAIPLVLAARFLAVGGAVSMLRRRRAFTPHAVKIMTWGGLRGGISVALALSLPTTLEGRGLFLVMTYVVVVFSIVVQGLTIGRLIGMVPAEASGAPGAGHDTH